MMNETTVNDKIKAEVEYQGLRQVGEMAKEERSSKQMGFKIFIEFIG
jgi:hypothetical protein